MRNLIRRWRGEGESYGISLDGEETVAIRLTRLSSGRFGIEHIPPSTPTAWLCARKDLTFSIRHVRLPFDIQTTEQNYIRAFAPEKFPFKDEPSIIRSDGIIDPDRTVFVHGITDKKHREILKDFAEAGIDPRRAKGLIPPAIAIHRAVELLEQRSFSKFTVILHLGHTGIDFVGVRGGRPVFHRSLHRHALETAVDKSPGSLLQHISMTVRHLENEPNFGVSEEVILTGPLSNNPTVLEDSKIFFPKSQIRLLDISRNIITETLSEDDIRANILSIGAATMGVHKNLSRIINFLEEPVTEKSSKQGVYDKIILGCGTAMLALAFVTANAFLLTMTQNRIEKISKNQAGVEQLRDNFRGVQEDISEIDRVVNAAAVRIDSAKSKTFSMPVSITKLLSAISTAMPEGITLDKIESGPQANTGKYSNFFSKGEPVTVTLSGIARLPEDVFIYQDALRERLGVSVDIVSIGKEGDMWAQRPSRFVIALRGTIRNA